MKEALRRDMESKRIDIPLSVSILERLNRGELGRKAEVAEGVPDLGEDGILDFRGEFELRLPRRNLDEGLARLDLSLPRGLEFKIEGDEAVFPRTSLERIGVLLYARTAFGILNGGVATSYADRKLNAALDEKAFESLSEVFEGLASLYGGRPKAICPAYLNPDGSPGESFLSLKLRALELCRRDFLKMGFESPIQPLRLFQMTSEATEPALGEAMRESTDRAKKAGTERLGERSRGQWETCEPSELLMGRQPLIAALSHSSEGFPKRFFDKANGKVNSALALPGGHGQNFIALKKIYEDLRARGYRYAYLTNIDNLGALPDPAEIAAIALLGKEAAFDFSYRTEVDVKGGILIRDGRGRMNCADLGQGIPLDEARRLEAEGKHVLFNCATGLFDLDWLVPRLEEIARDLPLRVSDEDKEIGKYSKAEQSTWETLSLLEDFLVFAVRKEERFLSAKFLMETILSSIELPIREKKPLFSSPAFSMTVESMKSGLSSLLARRYGMRLEEGTWRFR